MISGRRWAVQDRDKHTIYLTHERWQHIVAPGNHPEIVDFKDHVRETIRRGRRR